MASALNSTAALIRAHRKKVNGCTAPNPTLDDAYEICVQAHAVSVLIGLAMDDDVTNSDVLRSASRAVETLLETGIRYMAEGQDALLRRVVRH